MDRCSRSSRRVLAALVSVLACAPSCGLDVSHKLSCVDDGDCNSGYNCVEQLCQRPRADGNDGGDGATPGGAAPGGGTSGGSGNASSGAASAGSANTGGASPSGTAGSSPGGANEGGAGGSSPGGASEGGMGTAGAEGGAGGGDEGPPPTRRGLVVIADFADVTLEDYVGTGFTSLSEVRDELRLMSEHWAWLSRGRETFGWDIVRVTLPLPFAYNAYPDAASFRTAVLEAAANEVDPATYDLDADGKMDVVWVIASSQDDVSDNGFLTRGTSEVDGACVFVELQGGFTASNRNTGMFNHEVARCALGLPTLTGTYGTVGYLSLMDVSYPEPGQDFSAYERVRAGWTEPQRVTQSTTGLELTLKDDPVVLLIPGATKAEYFLMEYRRRPASGFGSGGLDYDGIVVYHVLESSQQEWNPPLLKVEPADGVIAAQTAANGQDLVYPENPSLTSPLSYRAYAGGAEVFRIQNLTRENETLRFDIVIAAPSPTNLLLNPAFEQGYGLPAQWSMEEFDPSATHVWEIDGADGGRSVSITAGTPNDANWHQTATGLTVGQSYLLCGKLSGKKAASTGGTGANLFAGSAWDRSQPLTGTFDWTDVCLPFEATATSMNVGCRLGYYYSYATGVIGCDQMALYELVKPF